jgi:hypothetical protein
MLHTALKPRGYLEIGVQHGTSLALAQCPAIGIDPAPMLQGHVKDTRLFTMTSDEFFEKSEPEWQQDYMPHIDLAFIDGMHLAEFALRDFMNVERYANPRTVIVFDDVLPRNQHEASREQCPGDWTGDVWKVPPLLRIYRPDLKILAVDTEPTGTCVVYNLNPTSKKLRNLYQVVLDNMLLGDQDVPQFVLTREGSVSAEAALGQVALYLQELGL